MPAPVVLFAFNRPDTLRVTLDALAANDLASETRLFIRLDGPRNEAEADLVSAVREVACRAHGFKSVDVVGSDKNRGLATSVIAGVEEILAFSEEVIVMEDDLVTHPEFLTFLNAALDRYRDDPAVFSVCGYSSDVRVPAGYGYDAYFCPRSSSWGWATWRDRWRSVDWNPTPASLKLHARAFNRWGGSDCTAMLRAWSEGRNSSWAIRFCYSQFLQGKVSLFPVLSLVNPSAGFDGRGTHFKSYSRFRFRMMPAEHGPFRLPDTVSVIPSICRSALRYHSLALRGWSYLMNSVFRHA